MSIESKLSNFSEKAIRQLCERLTDAPSAVDFSKFIKLFAILAKDSQSTENSILSLSNIHSKVLSYGLMKFPEILKTHMETKKKENSKTRALIKKFLKSLLSLKSDSFSDTTHKLYARCLTILSSFFYLSKQCLKKAISFSIEIWGDSLNVGVKLGYFLVLKEIGKKLDSLLFEKLLKRMFATFTENSKFVNLHNFNSIIFMTNCYQEIVLINPGIGYYVGFLVLKKVGELIRKLESSKNQETMYKFFNWKILNTIKLWGQIISLHKEFFDLIQPWYRIIEALLCYNFTWKFFPFYLHLLNYCKKMSLITGRYFPVASFYLKILESSEFLKKKESGTSKTFAIPCCIKIQKTYYNQSRFWISFYIYTVNSMISYLSVFSDSIFFPEICYFLLPKLKTIQKGFKFNLYKSKLKELLTLVNEDLNKVIENRKKFKAQWSALDNKEFITSLKNNKSARSVLKAFAKKVDAEQDDELERNISTEIKNSEIEADKDEENGEQDDEDDGEEIEDMEEEYN